MQLPLSEPVPLLPGVAVKVQHVRQSAGDPVPESFLHFHGPAELVLIEEGTGIFYCEDIRFPFAPASIVYAPTMAVHDFAFAKGARAWTLIQFDPHAVNRETVLLPFRAQVAKLDPATLARTSALADWLSQSLSANLPQKEVAVQLQALILSAIQAFDDKDAAPTQAPSSISRFRPLLDRMDTNPAQMLSLPAAASLCAMSPAYFSRLFSRTFGVGFAAYQCRMKLEQAARMLATGDESVSQIGYRLGFRSHAYFSHCFKTLYGVTPSCHRRGL
jgi:AraC-like DNA-binding protein